MFIHSKKIHILALLCLSVFLVQCNKKSKSDLAEFTVAPSRPVVITAPITYTSSSGNEITLNGPWFKFRVSMNNLTGDTVTIISLKAQVTGTDSTGAAQVTEVAYDPAENNFSNNNLTCNYGDFGQFVDKEDSFLGLTNLNIAGCPQGALVFPIGGLTDPKTGSYRYRVKVTAIGWFGTAANPKDRFQKSFYFSTQ